MDIELSILSCSSGRRLNEEDDIREYEIKAFRADDSFPIEYKTDYDISELYFFRVYTEEIPLNYLFRTEYMGHKWVWHCELSNLDAKEEFVIGDAMHGDGYVTMYYAKKGIHINNILSFGPKVKS